MSKYTVLVTKQYCRNSVPQSSIQCEDWDSGVETFKTVAKCYDSVVDENDIDNGYIDCVDVIHTVYLIQNDTLEEFKNK